MSEALRLANAIVDYTRRGFETEQQAQIRRMTAHSEAASLLRTQAARIAELEVERDRVCRLVVQMHAAATGYIQGPKRGVVEDVADLAAERDTLHAAITATLTEQAHLADGEDCTLIRLVRAIEAAKEAK
jgi:hypothetical protein